MKVRNGRPDILYEWEHTKQRPAAQDPGYMHDATDGKVLLDVNNHPIKDWPELPTTISGQVEGMWIEYWRRLNPQISLPDIVARCPKVTQKHASSKEHKLSIAAFGNRMRRHRVLLGTRAWEEREGSREIANRLKELMPNRVLAEIAGQNSTKTWRDLTNDEVDMVLSVNKGQGSAPARAGDKKLEGKKKDERDKAARAKTADIQRRMEAEKRGEDEEYEVVLAQRRADPGIGRSMSVSGYQTQEPAADVPSTLAQDAIGLGHISIESGRSMPAADVWGETSIGMHHQEEDADDSTFVEQPLDGTTLVEAVNPAEVLINSGKPEHDGDVGDETGTPVSVSDIPQAPTEETVDYTLRIPNAMIEFDSVDNSLEITRAEYRNLLRREPPISSRPFESSYQDQWTEIQESFNKKWLRDRPNTIPPLLPKRSGWTGSWDAWAAANVTGTNYDHPGVTISTDTGNSQSGCTGNLEWARALAATFGGLGANDDEFANPSGAPMTSGNPSAMDDLFKDHGAQTIVDPTSAVVDEQETPENCHPATTEEDAPGDLENDFDRFIRESQNVPLNFGEFERGIDDLGCLNDMFNGFAGGSGCLSFSGLENNIGDNSQFPPPAAGDTAPSPFPSEDPQCQATQQAHHPAQPSIAESTISPQCPAPSASQSEDLLTSNGDGQGSLSPPESDAGSQGWETQAWEGEDITNEEIDNLFDSIA
ncbi:MAG: hypothetical protein LQ343_000160 [Gyalolechia ehrenbergii]|nr:MAG: hypothetical protein LQ343_000160 [Gyalolechia ehrenbergii]